MGLGWSSHIELELAVGNGGSGLGNGEHARVRGPGLLFIAEEASERRYRALWEVDSEPGHSTAWRGHEMPRVPGFGQYRGRVGPLGHALT